jgi:Zinc finger, C2H2 type
MDNNFNLLKCKYCNLDFTKKYNYDRHVNSKYGCSLTSELTLDRFIKKQKNVCKYCNKMYERPDGLQRHISSTRNNCYKQRIHVDPNKEKEKEEIHNKSIQKIINKNYYKTINNNYNTQNITNNVQNIQQNIIQLHPIIEKVVLAKHGEETISHITKEVMLEILNIESFPKMCTELMRLLYFNKEVPENRNWTIVYPKNKNAGVEFNNETLRFERKKTYDIIDDKFSNMITLLFDLVQEISKDDIENNNLNKRQKININKYGMHFGQLDISKTSKEVYNSIHSFAYNSRIDQMKEWGDSGHQGNHLSLKFK